MTILLGSMAANRLTDRQSAGLVPDSLHIENTIIKPRGRTHWELYRFLKP